MALPSLPGSLDHTIKLWEVTTGEEMATLKGHSLVVYRVAFSPDATTLASSSRDGTILLWDMSPYINSTPSEIQSPSPPLPTQTALLANFPNPFNSGTNIPYQLHTPAMVSLNIYDIQGALVRKIDLGYRVAGQAGRIAHVRKMLVLK